MKINAYLKYAQNNGTGDSDLNKDSREMRLQLEKDSILQRFALIMFFFVFKMRAMMERFYTDGDDLGRTEEKLTSQEEERVTDEVCP